MGALDGAPCAHAALVDLSTEGGGSWDGTGTGERGVGTALERLHLDHKHARHTRASAHVLFTL